MTKKDLGFDPDLLVADLLSAARHLLRDRAHERCWMERQVARYLAAAGRRKNPTKLVLNCEIWADQWLKELRRVLIAQSYPGSDLGGFALKSYFDLLRSYERLRTEHAAVIYALVCSRYRDRGRVWMNKRPADPKLMDARRMLPADLMKKYGISRSYAYRLCRTAPQSRK
ncbi:MAG: hypothetical protein H6945_13495 [Zoogloeaceae bacterium]|nr:hypothetical protein [Rhodocyclaceae bacterium]MCP5236741.1 hypothetical protein [Zoogloeaceae bacterium]